MSSLKSYVIYSNTSDLNEFLSQEGAEVFTPVKSIKPSFISIFNEPSLFFNTKKAREYLGYDLSEEDIAKTLSHINCWKEISKNNNIGNNEFVLIAEAESLLVKDFDSLALEYTYKYPSYNIIKLQNKNNNENENINEKVYAIIYSEDEKYNNTGSSLYLIRKNIILDLIEKLEEIKPFWKSDYFSLFHNRENICESKYSLAVSKKQALSVTPKFSIIIPIYNVEKYLSQCIDSVLSQSFKNYEIILVNDGSQDSAFDICYKYAQKYQNIYIVHKSNGGLSSARNAGMQIAKGEYIIFLDSDDYWSGHNILSDLDNIIANHSPDAILHSYSYVKNSSLNPYILDIQNLTGIYQEDIGELCKRQIYRSSAWTKVIKRKILTDNNILFPEGKNHEDLDYSFELIKYLSSYYIYNSCFYIYRIGREGSITKYTTKRNVHNILDIMINKLNKLKDIQDSNLYNALVIFLKYQSEFTNEAYNIQPNENKLELQEKFNEYNLLVNKYLL